MFNRKKHFEHWNQIAQTIRAEIYSLSYSIDNVHEARMFMGDFKAKVGGSSVINAPFYCLACAYASECLKQNNNAYHYNSTDICVYCPLRMSERNCFVNNDHDEGIYHTLLQAIASHDYDQVEYIADMIANLPIVDNVSYIDIDGSVVNLN